MTEEQLDALCSYIKAVAASQAAFAVCGSTEGGFDAVERGCEEELRRVFLQPQEPTCPKN